jgi:hypothetical protein
MFRPHIGHHQVLQVQKGKVMILYIRAPWIHRVI